MTERYVVLGLARSRADWFRAVGRWSTAGALPVEFLRCVSPAELAARLRDGRPVSAVLLDGSLSGVDRDLLGAAGRDGVAVLVVTDGSTAVDWPALGAHAVLAPTFDRVELLASLAAHARTVGRFDVGTTVGVPPTPAPPGLRASVAVVCGPGGTGASTVAAALASGLAAGPRLGPVVLADLVRHAEQAMLHDVRDLLPGVQELVDGFRAANPGEQAVRDLTVPLPGHGYHLLLGLRRHRQWRTVRPRAFVAAFEALCLAFDAVVCDVDADFEGDEGPVGAPAERTLFARTAVAAADVVLAVGRPGTKGLHALVRVVGDVADAGVESARIVPVLVGSPRRPPARAEATRTVAELLGPVLDGPCAPVLHLPRRRVDAAVRSGGLVPSPLPELLVGAVDAVLSWLGPIDVRRGDLAPVVPGSLGLGAPD